MVSFLRRWQRLVGVDIGYFVRNGVPMAGSHIINLGAGLGLSVAFARLASTELYGQYQYVMGLLSLATAFALGGLDLAVMKAIISGEEGALVRGMRIGWWATWCALPLLAVIGWYQIQHGQALVGYSLYLTGILLPAMNATTVWSSFYGARKQYHRVALRLTLLQLLVVVGLVALLIVRPVLPLLVGWYLICHALVRYYFYWQAKAEIRNRKAHLDLTLATTVTAQKASQTLTAALPALVIAHFYGYSEVAIFGVAVALLLLVGAVANALTSVYLPQFFELSTMRGQRTKAVGLLLGLGLITALASYVGLRVGFIPLYGASYAESLRIVMWLLPLLVLFPLRAYFGHFATAMGYNITLIVLNVAGHILGFVVLLSLFDRLTFPVMATYYYLLLIIPNLIGILLIGILHAPPVTPPQAA